MKMSKCIPTIQKKYLNLMGMNFYAEIVLFKKSTQILYITKYDKISHYKIDTGSFIFIELGKVLVHN